MPVAISLLLESQWHIIEAAANVGIFTDERAGHHGVAIVDDALGGGLCLTSNALRSELSEVHLAVMAGEGERRTGWTPCKRVIPDVGLQAEQYSADFICDSSKGTTSISVNLFIERRRDDHLTISAGAGYYASAQWIKPDGSHRSFMQWFAQGRLFSLREGDPEVQCTVEGADKDVAGAATDAELVTSPVPRGEEIRLQFFNCAKIWHQAVVLFSVVAPDNNSTIG